MRTQRLYMNVYRSGHYHRQGKPGHCNIHGGDFFTDEMEALRNARADMGYIETVGFDMPVPDGVTILANPEGSVPTPLHITRNNPFYLTPWHTGRDEAPPVLTAGRLCPYQRAGTESLETSEADAVDPAALMQPWRDARPQGFTE